MNQEAKKFFSLIVATVQGRNTFTRTPFTKKVNVFSMGDVEVFPNRRLVQIQHSAFATATQNEKPKSIQLDDVIIENIIPLGFMTMEEFQSTNNNANPHSAVAMEVAATDSPTEH